MLLPFQLFWIIDPAIAGPELQIPDSVCSRGKKFFAPTFGSCNCSAPTACYGAENSCGLIFQPAPRMEGAATKVAVAFFLTIAEAQPRQVVAGILRLYSPTQ